MRFRTELAVNKSERLIDYHSKILLVGSCFSDHISSKLMNSGFDAVANPHGILFHPLAIERSLRDCLTERTYTKKDLLFIGEKWVSLSHHGKFNDADPDAMLDRINTRIRDTRAHLQQATHLLITLGTSWVYRHLKQDRLAANCHKIPQKEFRKELLSVQEIVSSLERLINGVKNINESLVIVFTVSPVRHLKDGMVENTLSKSRLHQAVHEMTNGNDLTYFPSYEIMMDDLRDYRFYERDLIHPNSMAIDYIWEKFCEAWIAPSVKSTMRRVEEINKSLEHRPLNPDSTGHLEFLQRLDEEIREIKKNHPEIRLGRE